MPVISVLRPNFQKRNGLIEVVVQDAATKAVLDVTTTTESGWKETLETGLLSSFTVAPRVKVVDMRIDCDGDAIVVFAQEQAVGTKWQSGWPDFNARRSGLVPVVAQDADTREVLMVAYVDESGFRKTRNTGWAMYFSPSRNESRVKGETSNNRQKIGSLLCSEEDNVLLYVVEPQGRRLACRTNARSCFYRTIANAQLMPAPDAGKKEELQTELLEVHENFAGMAGYPAPPAEKQH